MSITQIAKEAGVSVSTVSRYLRGTLNVTPTVAEKISRAASKSDYSPRGNPSRQDDAVALIIPSLQNPFYSELAQSISQVGISAGYRIDIKVSQGNPKIEEGLVRRIAEDQHYGNLLYAGLNNTNPALSQVQASGIHVVLLDEQLDDPALDVVDSVTVDNYSGAYQSVHYLLTLGHRHIAYLSGPQSLSTSKERFRGYHAALSAMSIPIDENIVFSGPYSEEFGSSIFPYLIERQPRPSAIFCGSDIAAAGLMAAAEQYGLKIPDDLSVVGCDGIHASQWFRPSLTTLQQPIEEIALSAFNLLASSGKQRHIQLPLNLVMRNSTVRIAHQPQASISY